FDGTQDFREAPAQLSGQDISQMIKDIVTVFGKLQKPNNDKKGKRKRNDEVEDVDESRVSKVFKKRCCLFQLPYWETLLVRHNLDPMHTEKNVYGNVGNTLLAVAKKSKDDLNSRLDLQEMGIRSDLHPQTDGSESYLPAALYSLSPQEKRIFCQVLKEARFPAGYASNLLIKVLVEEKRLVGLKTHDCHIIMCDLLPLAISRILPEKVSMPLVRLSQYFKKLYSKVICVHHMNTYKPIRKVRGPTKMKRMWKEYDPDSKIQLKFNRYGQPCGLKTCKLTSFIGYLVRGKEIPLANRNWSKGFFDIDESYKPWVLKSASKKWKDFKGVLKRKYFDPNLSKRQNISNGCANRISSPQWVWLVNHWKSNESQLKSEKNKAARAQQLNGRHTTGSRSNAVVLDQLEQKEGRKIGRAELFVATHTKRNGQPIDDYSGEKIVCQFFFTFFVLFIFLY
ncbi:unnamed protein product, partial [Urochloa humidicola]